MCLELVRTRAFAALLSDEVFADVDLETVQVSQPMPPSCKSTTVAGRGGGSVLFLCRPLLSSVRLSLCDCCCWPTRK